MAAAAAAVEATPTTPCAPAFIRLAGSATTVDGGLSRGVAWGDFDSDGLPDLIVANTIGYPEFLYRNAGAQGFVQIFEVDPTSMGGYTEGASWIDFDNDGDLDLLLTNTDGPNPLFRNDGDGELRRVDAGDLTADSASSSMACWADYDGDGWLDVLIVNRDGENDGLYRNVAGRFERVRRGPVGQNGGDGRACAWGDADGDGDLDVYVGNFLDYRSEEPAAARNYFYRNEGEGRFSEVTGELFVSERALTYGVSWADVDDDGDLDLYVSNIGRRDRNRLYLNRGDGEFVVSDSTVTSDSVGPSKGHTWGDFDLDGDLDLYVANGTEGTPDLRNFLYLNGGEGRFTRITEGASVTDAHVSAGTAWSDIDRDGDLDLYVANWGGSDEDNDLYRNDTSGCGRHWLALTLVGRDSSRMAIGGHVVAVTEHDGARNSQYRWLLPQTGYASQNEPIVHFGLDGARIVNELRIDWPSGRHDVHRNVEADRYYVVEEGGVIRPDRSVRQGEE